MTTISVKTLTKEAILDVIDGLDNKPEIVYIKANVATSLPGYIVEEAPWTLPGEAWLELENGEFVRILEA